MRIGLFKYFKLPYLLIFLWSGGTLFGQGTESHWFKDYQIAQITPTSLDIFWAAPSANFATLTLQSTDIDSQAASHTYEIATDANGRPILHLENLSPATIYSISLVDPTESPVTPITIGTASLSSGEIKVYFNQGINANVGIPGNLPNGTTTNQAIDELLTHINSAKYTIDVMMYNTNYDILVNALKAAKVRGIRVRYIADADQDNFALDPTPSFPVFFGGGNQDGIMHNKCLIIDANSTNPLDPWVSSGSTNWTTTNLTSDPNNQIFIQDQTLAKAYQIEFEEMWGSTGPNYNASTARFGAFKTDNTPHYFNISGVQVESYFSPSDLPHQKILNTVQSAQHSIDFGLLLITKDDVAQNMVTKKNQGINVRGILDDSDNLGNAYQILKTGGVQVALHTPSTIYHHKYAIIDVDVPSSDPLVLTGSHNWTYSAHTINDENTLIFHSATIADLYRKEFSRQWQQLVPVATDAINADKTQLIAFPNPTNGSITIRNEGADAIIHYRLTNSLGQDAISTSRNYTHELTLDTANLPGGLYFLELIAADGAQYLIPIWRN